MNRTQDTDPGTDRPCLLSLAGVEGGALECRAFVELEIEGQPADWCGVCGVDFREHLPPEDGDAAPDAPAPWPEDRTP